MEDIDELIVTDRPFKGTAESSINNQLPISTIFHLDDDWLSSLPHQATLLNIGSGITRIFEKEIKKEREDIQTISIDPTLAIDFKENQDGWYIEEYNHGSYLIYKRGNQPKTEKMTYSIPDNHVTYQKNRINSVTEIPGAIAALAPDLPFGNNSINVFFDTFGPSRYMEDVKKSEKYLTSLRDILKVGGTGYMNFIDSNRMRFLKSFPDLKVEIIEDNEFKFNGKPDTFHTIKITKTHHNC